MNNITNLTSEPRKKTKAKQSTELDNVLLSKVITTLKEDSKISPKVSVKLQKINNEVIAHYHQVVNK